MKTLAVIPARGGSKGIPRKNIRLINGKPLIYYAIHNARQCGWITDVVVSTDDEEIRAIAQSYGAIVLDRDSSLAMDGTTLDPVVYDAAIRTEQQLKVGYDIIVTMQPTSPTLKAETLTRAMEAFVTGAADTLIGVVNRPHLAWSEGRNGYFPLYDKRLNRQQLPPHYIETGAFLITRRAFVTPQSRMGRQVAVYEIPLDESVDIDTPQDWIVCEQLLSKRRIILRVDGHRMLGMGHIYHCLTLYDHMTGHDIVFVTKQACKEGLEKLKDSHVPVVVVEDDEAFFDYLQASQPDIVVHDCLDTTEDYMRRLKSIAGRVITIEDMGKGAAIADAAINALYEADESNPGHIYSGEKYVCLRDEFLTAKPKPFSDQVREIAVLFGGSDPSNLTHRLYSIAQRLHGLYPNLRFTFIAGLGYDCQKHGVSSMPACGIEVLMDCKRLSRYLERADLAVTSQGRTVYELASMGIPAIVLAQNEREKMHAFAQMKNGFLNMGLGVNVSDQTIENTMSWLIQTPQIRQEMRQNMLRHNLRDGVRRVIKIIMGD